MNHSIGLAVVILGCVAQGAFAQSFTGADVTLKYSSFTGDTNSDSFNLGASTEFAFNRSFGMQLDFAYTNFSTIEGAPDASVSGTNLTLHANYNINDSATAGFFVGRESLTYDDGAGSASDESTFVGVEVGFEYDSLGFEMYYARPLDDLIDNAAIYGLSGSVDVNDAFAITADYDRIDTGTLVDLSTASIGVQYEVMPDITLNAEVGSAGAVSDYGDVTETFVGLGATYTFGADRGATFDRRGIASEVPGL